MLSFYIVLFINTLLGYLARITGSKSKINIFLINPNIIFFLFITTIFIAFSGLRANTGLDTWMYRHSYDLVVMGMEPGYEPGFNELIKILIKISSDSQIFIFTTALVTNLFLMMSLKKYASYYELSIFLYVTSGYYLVTMNGIRQTFTASLFFYFAIKYMLEKKMFHYFIVIFILSFFHNSAKMLYPLYFLAIEKPWSKKIGLFILISLIGVLSFNSLLGVASTLSGGYSGYIDNFNEGGANILRVLVDVVPIALAFFNRKKLDEEWPESRVFINISLLNLVFMLFSLHNWIFARFSMYLTLSNLVLLPYIIKNCLSESNSKIIYILCIIFYLIYFYMENSYFGNTVYRSWILGIY
ncbi:EpsG family protein [Cetobacterium somerae]|uniref:EpsG family protein n=1 Tax=Cetobacterium somerae TaxID=188913 RepID=UPI00211E1BE4|nr:EpsG family protein [Cetobacterium somerae]MCQ9626464.1 EpsG family protein [Cetobacterium somerae]